MLNAYAGTVKKYMSGRGSGDGAEIKGSVVQRRESGDSCRRSSRDPESVQTLNYKLKDYTAEALATQMALFIHVSPYLMN